MTAIIVTDQTSAINSPDQQDTQQRNSNTLLELLLTSQAMARVALNDDFIEQEPQIVYTYLATLEEHITKAVKICDQLP